MKQSKNTLNQVIDFLLILPYLSLKNKGFEHLPISSLVLAASYQSRIGSYASENKKRKEK
jgi:hypothetical protein